MIALDKSDIEDIANGNHNRYVASQDKDELLRELASRLLKATPDTSDIDNKLDDISDCLDDISNCLDDIEEKLDDAENISDDVYDFCIRKLDDANNYINEVRDVLLTFVE